MLKSLTIATAAVLLFAAPALACTQITSATVKLSGCIDAEWGPIEGSGAQEFVYNTADGNFGLMVITEADVFAGAAFREAILANAVTGAGGDPAKVQVISERVETIADKAWNVIEYAVELNGAPLTFQNFYYTQPGFGSVQILGYSLTEQATSAAFKTGVFAATIQIGG